MSFPFGLALPKHSLEDRITTKHKTTMVINRGDIVCTNRCKTLIMNSKALIFIILCFGLKSTFAQSNSALNIQINEGSGFFQIEGGLGHRSDSITIYYHKPKNMASNSKILLVIPGAGRNGDSYRDSWIETSEKHSVLIISPSYPEAKYSYGDYHLGGIVKALNLTKGITFKKNSNQVLMDEAIVEFNINLNSNQWIYNDFDRIFNLVKKSTKSKQRKYDMFGHSAGGQILHRYVMMHPNSKADRILASNAGTYTLTDYSTDFPFGIKNMDFNKKQLSKAFKKSLVLFLGELDNADETGGRMLRSKTADKQGTHRLARGNYFYNHSVETAKELNVKFNWNLVVIPEVGHNQREMAKAAAKYLYSN